MPLNKAIENSKEIIAKISEVVPFLIEVYEKHKNNVKFLFVEYPACSFPEEYRQLSFPCLEENPSKERISICAKCQFNKTCAGIGKYYLNLYGAKEFKI